MKLKFIWKLNKEFGNDFHGVVINEKKKKKEFNCGNRRTIIREEGFYQKKKKKIEKKVNKNILTKLSFLFFLYSVNKRLQCLK